MSDAHTPILRWRAGDPPASATDELAVEEPLEIRVDARAVSVTMRTPGEDAELAVGFLVTEGLVASRDDIAAVEQPDARLPCNVIDVRLRPGLEIDFAQLTRHVFASSSCGLCGKTTIDAVRRMFPALSGTVRVDASTLAALPERLRERQAIFARTGGLHAAGLFALDGTPLVVREDVGRHNAVDKVVGWALRNGDLPLDRHILVVSGRSSFEIMQKALAARIPVVAAVSAPSSLAVQFARESGQTLVGFVRGSAMNVYAGGACIDWPGAASPSRSV